MNNKIYENYKKSLEQKFNAVCFDIDGTLTEVNSKKIASPAIKMIANLLNKKIPIVFITGRGETGLIDLKKDLIDTLILNYKISTNDLHRIFVLTNDGARMFYSEGNDILLRDVYLTSNNALEELKYFDEKIVKYLNQSSLMELCNITYSRDLKNNKILNIRIVFNTINYDIINSIYDSIKKFIEKNNLHNIHITRGVYKDNIVLQIGTAKKNEAIIQAEKIIGIPQNSMIRIGDCGDVRGNDFSMLNCEQGYSVDKTSNFENSCFPIFDDDGNILKGINATLYLINHAKIIPTVCLEHADRIKYTHDYALTEKKILEGRNKYLKKYNDIVNRKFNLINGINDLFDRSSGSIKIPMYEWELIPNSALKNFWNTNQNRCLCYSMRDNNNYLLRGSKIYYYFLANRESINGKDITTGDNITEWYSNNQNFISNAKVAISETHDFKNIYNVKMILGILDNLRNVLIVILNHEITRSYHDKNILLKLNSKNNTKINNIYKILYLIDEMIAKSCFNEDYTISKNQIMDLMNLCENYIDIDKQTFINSFEDIDFSKEFRAYREIDNFAENYITAMLNKGENIQDTIRSVCGMSYGGIELPIIYKLVNSQIEDVLILKLNKKVSGYKNKQLVELRKFNINNYGGLLLNNDILNNSTIILDDNILTGKTIQLAMNTLYDAGIETLKVGIVRYPSMNRVDQMFMKNHGAVDYNLFFEYIVGLCFPSPYSWRDDNDFDLYMDSLGVFDLNRKKIVECLIKNHDYKAKSEVAEYKRRILK